MRDLEKLKTIMKIVEVKRQIEERKEKLKQIERALESIKLKVILETMKKEGMLAGGYLQVIKRASVCRKQVRNKYGREYEYAACVIFLRNGRTKTIYLGDDVLEMLRKRKRLREELRELYRLLRGLHSMLKIIGES